MKITLKRINNSFKRILKKLLDSDVLDDIKKAALKVTPILATVKTKAYYYGCAYGIPKKLTKGYKKAPITLIGKSPHLFFIDINLTMKSKASNKWLDNLVSHEFAHIIVCILENNKKFITNRNILDHGWLWQYIHKSMGGDGLQFIP